MGDASICFAFTMDQEGGSVYSNTPGDNGGPTKWGVTLKLLQDYRKDHTLSADDVKALSYDEAQHIFREAFYVPMRCDELPSPAALMAVDFAYHSGQHAASVALQHVLGCVPDGSIGPSTIKAACATPIDSFISAYGAARLTFMQCLPSWAQFHVDWQRRVFDAMIAARKLI